MGIYYLDQYGSVFDCTLVVLFAGNDFAMFIHDRKIQIRLKYGSTTQTAKFYIFFSLRFIKDVHRFSNPECYRGAVLMIV